MTLPDPAGCLWPLDTSCLDDEWQSESDEGAKLAAQALASATLRRLCAYRVGGCPRTVRPCQNVSCGPTGGFPYSTYDSPYVPLNWNGTWTNACTCVGPCRHNPATAVKLQGPVYGVSEVKVDGEVVDEANYWTSGDYLIGLAGQEWPLTQNLDLPDTEPGTFSVTYSDSAPVDLMGARAAARLAIEYVRACKGGTCGLPETVTSLVRQGVTYDIPAGAFPNGETGIREVDAFIALWNPKHRMNRTQVWVP